MNKLITKICILVLLVSILIGCMPINVVLADNEFAGGSGTASDPYLISNANHLNNIRNKRDKYFKLTKDIDLGVYSEGAGWEPIEYFEGILDGGEEHYKILNLYINRPNESKLGLFKEISEDGEILNVSLINIKITGKDGIGGITHHNSGYISNCSVSGSINGSWIIGGITGINAGIIANSNTDVNLTGSQLIGGIAGYNINSSDEFVHLITNSYAKVNIVGEYSVGGIVGSNYSRISSCYSSGKVIGVNAVGGLAGSNEKYSDTYTLTVSITDSYSLCEVEGNEFVGGLVGGNYEKINNCYSVGLVTGLGNVGGLVGKNTNNESVANNYWDIEKSNMTTSNGGTGKTTTEMKSKNTYTNWDFDSIWNITSNSNSGYPVLRVNEYVREIKNNIPILRSNIQSSIKVNIDEVTPYKANLSNVFIDPDNDNMTYRVSINGGSYVVVNSSYTYTPASLGETVLVFKANDGKSDSDDTYAVYISVEGPKNKMPTIRSDVQSSVSVNVEVGTPYAINLNNVFSDPDNDNITFKVSVDNREYSILNSSYYSFIPESKGEIKLVFRANDGKEDSVDVYTVTLSVTEPVIQTYTLKVISSAGGIVAADIENSYVQGDIIKLVAKPSAGYVFMKWTSIGGGRLSSESDIEITFTMPGNNAVVNAEFEIINPVMKPVVNKHHTKGLYHFIKQLY